MTTCPLEQPGILQAMVDAEPAAQPQLPTAAIAVAARVAAGWFLGASALVAGLAIAADSAGRTLPFGANGNVGFAAVAGAMAIGYWLAALVARALLPSTYRTLVVGCAIPLLVAVAALLAAAGRQHTAAAWFPLAAGHGILLAALGRRQSGFAYWVCSGLGVAAGAGLAAGLSTGAAEEAFFWLVAATLVAAAAAAVAPESAGQPVRPARRRGRLVSALGRSLALAALVWAWPALDWPATLPAGLTILACGQGRARVALVAAAATALAAAWPFARAAAGDHTTVVATAGEYGVHYGRANQELRLLGHGELLDVAGPGRTEVPLAATLLRALARPGERGAVFELGSARLATTLWGEGRYVLDCVDADPGAEAVRDRLLLAGPVAADAPASPRAPVRFVDPRAAIFALAAGSRQWAVFAAGVARPGVRTSSAAQRQLREVVGTGLVVQVLALDHVPPRVLHELFAAAAAAHAWNGLFVVGDGAVLVSASAAPDWSRVEPLATWPAAARWCAHRTHVADLADLQLALLGTLVVPKLEVAVGATGRSGALAVLHAWLAPSPEVPPSPHGVLLRWQARQAEVRASATRVRALADDAVGHGMARNLAAQLLHVGAAAPELQAALGLAGADDSSLVSPAAASRRAHAIDPTFFQAPPAVCRSLPRPSQVAGDLEDLAALPPRARLATLAVGDNPLAVALRVRWPSECAEALVAILAAGPLPVAAAEALRELADPFVLREAGLVLTAAARERELLGLWRGDLPMPAALQRLLGGDAGARRALVVALRGRRDPSCHPVLAEFLEADELELRQLAGEALVAAVGAAVPYDANWPQSARREAAQRLRSLHNRTP